MKTWKKILLAVVLFLVVGMVVLILSLPSMVKSYIEEHDMELIGREILIKDLSLNFFTLVCRIDGFQLKEKDGKKDFVSFDNLTLNMEWSDLFSKSIFIKECSIDGFFAGVEQNNESFNFDDLLALGETPADTAKTDNSEPWHFTLHNFSMTRASVAYTSDLLEPISLDSIYVWIPAVSDTSKTIRSKVDFEFSTGGQFHIQSLVDLVQSNYLVNLKAVDLNMKFLAAYLDPYLKFNAFEGYFDTDLNFGGNWENTAIFNLGGDMKMRDFLLTDIRDEKVIALKTSELSIDTIRMNDAVYNFNYYRASGFYGLYEMYDEGDNFTNMLRDTTSTEMSETDSTGSATAEAAEIDYSNPFAVMGYYLKDIAKSYTESTYRIGDIAVTGSSFDFNDYTPQNPFRYHLTDMSLKADSLNSKNETISLKMGAALDGTGRFDGSIELYTDNLENLDLHYTLSGTELVPFSPYTSAYVNYPIALGDLKYVCNTTIRNGIIESQNVIDVNKFDFGKKLNGNAPYNLPVKLAVSLLKDVHGNIHLDVPIEGDLKDPKYKLGKVIWGVVKNLLLKAVSAPYKLLANTFGFKEEDLKRIDFALLQMQLNKTQENQLEDLVKIMAAKPELNIDFKRATKKYDEVERYAMMYSKYRYLYKKEPGPPEDIPEDVFTEVRNFDIKDSLFNVFVDENVPEIDRELPVQRKCILLVGEQKAIAATDNIGAKRTAAIQNFLVAEKQVNPDRLRFTILPPDSLTTNRSAAVYHVDFWVDQ